MSNFACPVCSATQFRATLEFNRYQLVRCADCSLLSVYPMPTPAQLNEHYQNITYFEGEEAQGYRNYADMHKALQPHFERRLQAIENYITDRRILDFGCADGYFLTLAKAKGWQINGVELSEEMAKRASETLALPIARELATFPTEGFDAISLWEVIEHLPKPVEQLTELLTRLRPGGLIALSTPNNGHWQALRQPDTWSVYRPPSHLIYFDRKTLYAALTRAGFIRVQIQGTMPLPPLPLWLQKLSEPLRQQLGNGSARNWCLALYSWRAIRLLGWAWQKIAYPQDDVFTTLEAIAFRP